MFVTVAAPPAGSGGVIEPREYVESFQPIASPKGLDESNEVLEMSRFN